MAEDSGSGEKTEEPTPERLRKLREEGNISKSKDITSAIGFLVVFVAVGLLFPFISTQMADFTLYCIKVMQHPYNTKALAAAVLAEGLWSMVKACIPVLGVEFILAIVLNVAQVGFLFTLKPITPDLNRINPINGFKNLFGMKKMVELLKTIIKFVVISYLSYAALKRSLRDVTFIIRSDLFVGVKIVGAIIWDFVSKISVVFIIIAAADAFYQKKRYLKDNRMTKHDIKQEYKQSEGDPQHKADRRKLHQEILSGGGSGVKGSDVVVRNPDHLAVALKYDKEKGAAPMVMAKGARLWAEQILEAARQYDVPVVHNVPLAQALYSLDVDDEIPESLYQAVAEVLTFVYALADKTQPASKPVSKNVSKPISKNVQGSRAKPPGAGKPLG